MMPISKVILLATLDPIRNENSNLSSLLAVVNVYTTHIPEISSTLPTIIMQDESITNNSASSTNANVSMLSSRLTMPTDQPPYALLGDDILKHSFSDDGCSSEDRSDIEIDI